MCDSCIRAESGLINDTSLLSGGSVEFRRRQRRPKREGWPRRLCLSRDTEPSPSGSICRTKRTFSTHKRECFRYRGRLDPEQPGAVDIKASGDDVPILLDCEKLDADWDGLRADAKEVFVAQLRTKNEVEAGKAMLLEAAERVVKDQALLP